MIRFIGMALVAGLVLAAAPAPVPKDMELLQGTWRADSAEFDGKSQEINGPIALVITKDTLVLQIGESSNMSGKFIVDPFKNPKTIDLFITEATIEDSKGKRTGIYEVTKDRLTWCTQMNRLEGDRPKTFRTKKDSNNILLKFKKEKP